MREKSVPYQNGVLILFREARVACAAAERCIVIGLAFHRLDTSRLAPFEVWPEDSFQPGVSGPEPGAGGHQNRLPSSLAVGALPFHRLRVAHESPIAQRLKAAC